jgi:3-dehydroquinate synthetase
VIEVMAHDKKRDGDKIKLVLPTTRLGLVELDVSVSASEFVNVI